MERSTPVFDMDALGHAERLYRTRLEQDPGDTGTRLNLAWCLVMQAFYEAGQERVAAQLPVDNQAHAESTARRLLRSSLKEAVVVLQLSSDPHERTYVKKLCELVRLSGEKEAVREANEEGDRILTEVMRVLLFGTDLEAEGPETDRRPPRLAT